MNITDSQIKKCEEIAKRFYNAVTFDKLSYDLDKIKRLIEKDRTFQGEPIRVEIVESPDKVIPKLIEIIGSKEELRKLEPHNCIWDFDSIALWEACYDVVPENERPAFLKDTFYEAIEAGLCFIVNFGGLYVGCPRPRIYFDDRNRVHRADGPAFQWGGLKFYWWHGVEVPAAYIEDPDSVPVPEVLKNGNAEQRRAYFEKAGWTSVLNRISAKEIQKDDFGALYETNELNDDNGRPGRFVRCVCPSTDRVYFIRVAPSTKTARQGLGSLFVPFRDKPEESYAPISET